MVLVAIARYVVGITNAQNRDGISIRESLKKKKYIHYHFLLTMGQVRKTWKCVRTSSSRSIVHQVDTSGDRSAFLS